MDRLLKRFKFRDDDDLCGIDSLGIAYQKDMFFKITYDENYYKKFDKYKNKTMSDRVNRIRCNAIEKIPDQSGSLLDVGSGNCSFVKYAKGNLQYTVKGFDVNPVTKRILEKRKLWCDDFEGHKVYTFFDVLEHVDMPELYLKRIPENAYAVISIPVFNTLKDIRSTRHYLPGEHLYYFTPSGFEYYMKLYGFERIYYTDEEQKVGRSNSMLYVFKKSGADSGRLLSFYSDMHTKFYGSSAYLYFDIISRIVVKKNPKSILDYGCGRSDMVSYFWNDGLRKLAKYDPAITEFKTFPDGVFDLVLCTDVMEHIPMRYVDSVLSEIRLKSQNVIFTISLRLARAKFPDGSNVHVTLLKRSEWIDWIREYFGNATEIDSGYDHILMVRTF